MFKLTILKTFILLIAFSAISCKRKSKPETVSAEEASTTTEEITEEENSDTTTKSTSPKKVKKVGDRVDNSPNIFTIPITGVDDRYSTYLTEKEKIHTKWYTSSAKILENIEVFTENSSENKAKWVQRKRDLTNQINSEFSSENIRLKVIEMREELNKLVILHIHIVNKIADKELAGEDASQLLIQDKEINENLFNLTAKIDHYTNNSYQLKRDALEKVNKDSSIIGYDKKLDELLIQYEEMYQEYCSERQSLCKKYAGLIKSLSPVDINYSYMTNDAYRHYIELYNQTDEECEIDSYNVLFGSKDFEFALDLNVSGASRYNNSTTKNIRLKPYQSVFVEIMGPIRTGNTTPVHVITSSYYNMKPKSHATLFQTMKDYTYAMRDLKRPKAIPKALGYNYSGDKRLPIKLQTHQISEKYRNEVLKITAKEQEILKSSKNSYSSAHSSNHGKRRELSEALQRERQKLAQKYKGESPSRNKNYAKERNELEMTYRDKMRELFHNRSSSTVTKAESSEDNIKLILIQKEYISLDKKFGVPANCLLVIDAIIEFNGERYVKLRNTSGVTISNAFIILKDKKSFFRQSAALRNAKILPGESVYMKVKSSTTSDVKSTNNSRPLSTTIYTQSRFMVILKRSGEYLKISDASSTYSGNFVINSQISQLK